MGGTLFCEGMRPEGTSIRCAKSRHPRGEKRKETEVNSASFLDCYLFRPLRWTEFCETGSFALWAKFAGEVGARNVEIVGDSVVENPAGRPYNNVENKHDFFMLRSYYYVWIDKRHWH